MTETTDRRTLLADAAIETLAAAGMRGFTHRAVDRTANLPEGSCSNVFRTRQALLHATVDRLTELDARELTALPDLATADRDTFVTAAVDLLRHWTTTGRTRMLARYELALESTRRPELRIALAAAGTRIRALAEHMLAAAGAPDPAVGAELLVAHLDGLVFDRLAGAGALELTPEQLTPYIGRLIRTMVTPDEPHGTP
ncbi:TetR/AcrR family transcriptional regulator [Nocardia paucivorans]|uniref:TetR/AcrR family transcriptional regulator n=1 Tax=Nocardia paucivorans TaxID=114259 RepID=UPI0002FB7E44|nr:hypothetical protein [Nocardia paucivorans]